MPKVASSAKISMPMNSAISALQTKNAPRTRNRAVARSFGVGFR
jgi:hypothetical protein